MTLTMVADVMLAVSLGQPGFDDALNVTQYERHHPVENGCHDQRFQIMELGAPTRVARHMISWTNPVAATSAESLVMAMKSLPMGGMAKRSACGRTILCMV
jgi:hypothetical protein